MKKYRILKAKSKSGFDLYRLHDEGNGWSKEYLSHYDIREDAEKAAERLKKEDEQNFLQIKGG